MILTPEDYTHLTAIVSVLALSQLRPEDALLERLKEGRLEPSDIEVLVDLLDSMRTNIERTVFGIANNSERHAAVDTIHWCSNAIHELESLLS